jgi:alpha-mannosidase
VVAGRELLPAGRKVDVELAPDHPVEYDAWDVEEWTRGLGSAAGRRAVRHRARRRPAGGHAAKCVAAFGRSTMSPTLTVRAGSPRLDLTFDVDWQQDEQLLSLMVPLDVHAREAACDIQFGHVMRPTHASSSWDAAKFEVCAHRFVSLAEPASVSLCSTTAASATACRRAASGCRCSAPPSTPTRSRTTGSTASPSACCPTAPAARRAARGRSAERAAAVRWKLATRHAAPPARFVSVEHPGVQVSAVKRADDGSGDLIVRLYEACGARTQVAVRTPQRVVEASCCNLLEEPQLALDIADGFVNLTLRPFQLATLRLRT